MSRPTRLLVSADDLSDQDVQWILARAAALATGAAPLDLRHRVIGLLFLEPSLRTRLGFAAAAARLGAQSVEVNEHRGIETTESVSDTLQVMGAYVDAIIARPGVDLDCTWLREALPVPFISGGGKGPNAEHPTQGLIDLAAMEALAGPIANVHICICGDPRMRTVRSLLKLLRRTPPAAISVIAPASWYDAETIPSQLRGRTAFRAPWSVDDVDVLYIAGMRHATIDLGQRQQFVVGVDLMARLPDTAVVLSPMPVIDEITSEARADYRVRVFDQSAHGLYVRIAILERFFTLASDISSGPS